jgi:hypothetical protein
MDDTELLAIRPDEVKSVVVIVANRGGITFDDLLQATAHVYGVNSHDLANQVGVLLLRGYEDAAVDDFEEWFAEGGDA